VKNVFYKICSSRSVRNQHTGLCSGGEYTDWLRGDFMQNSVHKDVALIFSTGCVYSWCWCLLIFIPCNFLLGSAASVPLICVFLTSRVLLMSLAAWKLPGGVHGFMLVVTFQMYKNGTKIAVERLRILLSFRQVLGWNRGPETGFLWLKFSVVFLSPSRQTLWYLDYNVLFKFIIL
jgi:hypothetical protein